MGRKIADIQVLRAIAIGLVLLQHLSLPANLFKIAFPSLQMPFWIGVELFFIISGYVVTRSILDRPLSPSGFLIRRAFRLLPALGCFVVLSGIVAVLVWALPVSEWGKANTVASPDTFVREAAAILAGVLTITGHSARYTNGAMWSLSVEFQFYFAFALAMAAGVKLSSTHARKAILWIATALYVLCLAGRLIGPLWGAELPRLMKYLLFWKFDFLLLGMIGATLPPLAGLDRVKRLGPLIAPLLMIAALIVIAHCEPAHFVDYAFRPLLDGVGVPTMGVLLLGVVLLASRDAAFGREGKVYRVAVWVGELSYSIYLFHLPVFALLWLAIDLAWPAYFHYGDLGALQALASVSVSVLIASSVYRYVEAPANRYGAALAARLEQRSVRVSAGSGSTLQSGGAQRASAEPSPHLERG